MMGINAVNTKEGYVEIFLTLSLTWNDPCFFLKKSKNWKKKKIQNFKYYEITIKQKYKIYVFFYNYKNQDCFFFFWEYNYKLYIFFIF